MLGCDYCKKQSAYWIRNEWRYVELIGPASAHLEVGRCPKCGTHYIYGAENMGRPGFVTPDRVPAMLQQVEAYESSLRETETLEQLVATRGDKAAVVEHLLRAVIAVPMEMGVGAERGRRTPLTVMKEGCPSVVAFTRAEGADQVASRTPYVSTMPATSLILRMTDDQGLVLIAPNGEVDLEPSLVTAIRTDLQRATSDGSAD